MASPVPNVLTMGEPAGIGGELALKTWKHHRHDVQPFFVLDCPERLRGIAKALNLDVDIVEIAHPGQAVEHFPTALPVMPLVNAVDDVQGNISLVNAAAIMESIERAVAFALAGDVAALVTNPIQKDALYAAGFRFPGHTEYLAELAGGGMQPVMMLASPMLRVVPVTVHVSLRRALDMLSVESIVRQGQITIDSLRRDFGIAVPRIAVAGLNPHAGEAGNLGDDEGRLIVPAINALQKLGAEVFGPVPPDALFTARARPGYDVALCMYHDQALIPIKALDFDRAVNVTLGLPIVRTSPDHGTALDIAGKGIADPSSLVAAMSMASEIAAHRHNSRAG